MQNREVAQSILDVLQEHSGKFMLAYQIFRRLEQNSPDMAQNLRNKYPTAVGHPEMGRHAGTYYSVATYISQTLDRLRDDHQKIRKALLVSDDIQSEGIEAGDPRGLTIWSWAE